MMNAWPPAGIAVSTAHAGRLAAGQGMPTAMTIRKTEIVLSASATAAKRIRDIGRRPHRGLRAGYLAFSAARASPPHRENQGANKPALDSQPWNPARLSRSRRRVRRHSDTRHKAAQRRAARVHNPCLRRHRRVP